MTQRALGYLLRELRTRCRKDLNDGQLLERFCAAREEAAFTLLADGFRGVPPDSVQPA